MHSKAYPTTSQLRSGAKLPRVEFPKVHAAVFSAPDWAGEKMEGQMRGGFPRVSSHPENLADLAAVAAAIDTPFTRCAFFYFGIYIYCSLPLGYCQFGMCSDSTDGTHDPAVRLPSPAWSDLLLPCIQGGAWH